jgi:hypothetical protein
MGLGGAGGISGPVRVSKEKVLVGEGVPTGDVDEVRGRGMHRGAPCEGHLIKAPLHRGSVFEFRNAKMTFLGEFSVVYRFREEAWVVAK